MGHVYLILILVTNAWMRKLLLSKMVNASVQVLGILLIIKENVNHVQLLNLDVLTARKTLHINAMNVQVNKL